MNIAFGSMLRNAESYVPRFAAQVAALREAAPQHTFRPILAEGDSHDGTWDALKAAFNGCVFKREHGGPVFGSTGEEQRFRQMAWVKQAIFEKVLPTDDVMIYVESDLIWKPEVMLGLLSDIEKPGVDCVVPFVSHQGRFFDSWGYRGLDGINFGNFPPFHVSLLQDSVNGLYPLSAAGSCLALKGEMARTCRFEKPELEIVGFTQDAIRKGFKIWVDMNLTVYHP